MSRGGPVGGDRVKSPTPSLWHDELPGEDVCPPLSTDIDADFLVIGGGFTGLSAARELSRLHRNARVVLVEARFCGFGASGRNSGFLNYTCVGHDPKELLEKHGATKAAAISAHARAAVNHVKELVDRFGIPCDFEDSVGLAYAALNSTQMDKADAISEAAAVIGCGAGEIWDAQTCSDRLGGSTVFAGAYVDPGACHVQPFKLARGLLTHVLLPNMSVRVYEQTPIVSLRKRNRSGSGEVYWVASTDRGQTITAGQVVLATNAYTQRAPYKNFFAPIHVYSVATAPLDEAAVGAGGACPWPTRTGFYTLHHILDALRLTSDNRLVVATCDIAYHAGDELHVPSDSHYAALEDKLFDFYCPGLDRDAVPVTHRWEGVIAVNFEDLPSVGVDSDGMYYSLAYCGHGVALANYAGVLLAQLDAGNAAIGTSLPFVNSRPSIPIPPEPVRTVLDATYINALRWLDSRVDNAHRRRLGKTQVREVPASALMALGVVVAVIAAIAYLVLVR